MGMLRAGQQGRVAPHRQQQELGETSRGDVPEGRRRAHQQHGLEEYGHRMVEAQREELRDVLRQVRVAQILDNVRVQTIGVGVDQAGRQAAPAAHAK